MRVRILTAGLLVAAAAPVAALAATKAMHPPMHPELGAKLLGRLEVPKGAPRGHGIVNLTLSAKKRTVCWTFEGIAGIDKPTVAHIHRGPLKKAGPVVVPLGAAYKAKGCTRAATKLIAAIESHPNGYYVNVHTKKYPAGAIRGQLVVGMMHM
jgi:hypothetical protein